MSRPKPLTAALALLATVASALAVAGCGGESNGSAKTTTSKHQRPPGYTPEY